LKNPAISGDYPSTSSVDGVTKLVAARMPARLALAGAVTRASANRLGDHR